jgi:hypothetical protein
MHRPVLAELPGSAADLIPSNQRFFLLGSVCTVFKQLIW